MRPRGAFQGMIAPDHADGLADEEAELATHAGLRLLLEGEGLGQPRVVVERRRPRRRRIPWRRRGGRRTRGARSGPGPRSAPLQLGGDGPQVLGPLLVGQARPRALVEGLARRGDRPGHVGLLGLGDAEEELLARGVDDVDHGVRRGLHPLPADEEPIRVPQGCTDVVGDGHGVSNREVSQLPSAALGDPKVRRDSP